jgi:disulfide bond formation protein DsbB
MTKDQAAISSGRRWGQCLLLLFLWAVSVPLIGAFWVQFVWKEAPCPLCLLQRMCMILAGMGVIWILTAEGAINRTAGPLRWSQGFAMTVLAATLGLCISLRQMLLHIAPDDPGFGSPILGYHLYSWAFGIFVVILLCSGISLLMTQSLSQIDDASKRSRLTRISIWMFGLVILANALVVGFNAASELLAAGATP